MDWKDILYNECTQEEIQEALHILKTNKMKTQILQALANLNLSESDFDINFEGDQRSTDRRSFEISTENYWIDLEVVATFFWKDWEDVELEEIEIDVFIVYDKEGEELDSDHITDNDLINALNI